MSPESSSGERPQDTVLAEAAKVIDSAASREIEAEFQARFCVEANRYLLTTLQNHFGPVSEPGYRTSLALAAIELYTGYVDALKDDNEAVDESIEKAVQLISGYFGPENRESIYDLCTMVIIHQLPDLH